MTTQAGQPEYGCYGFHFFDEMPEPSAQMESVGREVRSTKDYYFDGMLRKERNRYLFQYTLSGSGMFVNRGKPCVMEPGRAFLAKIPGNHVYFLPESGSRWEFIFIMIYGSEAEKYWDRILAAMGPTPYIPPAAPIIRLLNNIFRDAACKKIQDGYQSAGLAYQFLMELCRAAHKPCEADYTDRIRSAVSGMKDNAGTIGGIEEIANRLGISQHHFIRQFTKTMGVSPGKYLSKIRMEKAVDLLIHTDLPLESIAASVGYSNANYFGKAFQRYLGMSPGEFRRERKILPYTHMVL